MKCEACKEFDKKLEEAIEEFDITDLTLKYIVEGLKINRLMNCTCGENMEAANEALNSQNSQTPDMPPEHIDCKLRCSDPLFIEEAKMKDKHGVEFKAGDIYFYSERNLGDPLASHADYADSFYEVVEEDGKLKAKTLLVNFKGEYISEEDAERIIPGSTPWKLEELRNLELGVECTGFKECYEIIPAIKREHITKDSANKVYPLGVKAANAFHSINASFLPATTAASSLKPWTKNSEEILSDIKTLEESIESRKKELNTLFEELDTKDMSAETRAILKRMRSVFSEDYPLCKIIAD